MKSFLNICLTIVLASWYGPGFHGKTMANGQKFNQYALTVASPYLPLGTIIKITHLKNKRIVIAKVTDRGPYRKDNKKVLLDVSYIVAKKLGMLDLGIAQVKIEVI